MTLEVTVVLKSYHYLGIFVQACSHTQGNGHLHQELRWDFHLPWWNQQKRDSPLYAKQFYFLFLVTLWSPKKLVPKPLKSSISVPCQVSAFCWRCECSTWLSLAWPPISISKAWLSEAREQVNSHDPSCFLPRVRKNLETEGEAFVQSKSPKYNTFPHRGLRRRKG